MPHSHISRCCGPGKSWDTLLLGNRPQFQSLVPRARYNGPSIWTESHTAYIVAVALESLETLSTRNRPQFQSIVPRARYNGPSIWTESHTVYRVAVMAPESHETLSTRKHPTVSKSCRPSQIQQSFHLDWMPHSLHFRLWPWKVLRHSPPETDHSFKVLSLRARYNGPSIWTECHTHIHSCCGPGKSWDTLHQETDHSFKVLSYEPDTTVLPSGLNATLDIHSRCGPRKVLRHSPFRNRTQFQSIISTSQIQRFFHLDWKHTIYPVASGKSELLPWNRIVLRDTTALPSDSIIHLINILIYNVFTIS